MFDRTRPSTPSICDNGSMARDRCANRRHSLGTPPPARKDRRVPRNGCMRCVEAPKGTCPYREVWECSDEVREVGLQLGHCVVEEIHRATQREKAMAMMAPAGRVTTQEIAMSRNTFRLIAAIPPVKPTPMTAPTVMWVVDTGRPVAEASTTVVAAASVAQYPRVGVSVVI